MIVRAPGIDDLDTAHPHPDAVVHFCRKDVFARFGGQETARPADGIIGRVHPGGGADPVPVKIDFRIHPAHHLPVKIGPVEILPQQAGLGMQQEGEKYENSCCKNGYPSHSPAIEKVKRCG